MTEPDPVHELRLELAKVHELIRVVKHDRNNDAQGQVNFERNMDRMEKKQDKFEVQLEKLEGKLGDKIEVNHTILTSKIDAIKDSISMINVQQGKSVGFYGGVAAVFTIAVTIILFLVKLLFEGRHP